MKELDVRHFKLLNGDDIIALVADKNDDNIVVERPVVVSNTLLGGFQFAPWFPFSNNKNYKILKSSIVEHVGVAEEVKETYVKFALKLKEKITMPSTKTDEELLAEYEDKLINEMAEEGFIPEDKTKKTIH